MTLNQENGPDLKRFQFRDLHPKVYMGTASDRYSGWIGQIYSEGRYKGRTGSRSKMVKGESFAEEVLPVESVEEYFQHFRTLELDFTFYRSLMDMEGRPTQNFHLLHNYRQHLNRDDRIILKVPQNIFARKLRRGSKYLQNEEYLDPEIFVQRFYQPALELLGPWLDGLIFEQEYQRKEERSSPQEMGQELDTFFKEIPRDDRYHVELRTETFLAAPIFDVFEKYGIGQVLSHWTWLPPLSRQFKLSGRRFLNAARCCIIRLMTPRGMRYEKAYAKAHPFNALVDGMLNLQMVKETADLMKAAIQEDVRINVIVNNRAGGNAPLIAQQIAREFLSQLRA
jgi:uncharacterized protein YecE (DUF72 family)